MGGIGLTLSTVPSRESSCLGARGESIFRFETISSNPPQSVMLKT